MHSHHLHGLYAITDSILLADGRLLPFCEAALRGGARLLQYRDKSKDAKKRLREADALRNLCEKHGARLVINDDLPLAKQLACDVHLGQSDGSLIAARQQLGQSAIVGATCHHHLHLATKAIADGASYTAFRPLLQLTDQARRKPGQPCPVATRATFRSAGRCHWWHHSITRNP